MLLERHTGANTSQGSLKLFPLLQETRHQSVHLGNAALKPAFDCWRKQKDNKDRVQIRSTVSVSCTSKDFTKLDSKGKKKQPKKQKTTHKKKPQPRPEDFMFRQP